MIDDREGLVHLGGYASITAVLASANWAGPLGMLLAMPIILVGIYVGLQVVVDHLTARARHDLVDDQPATVATDGGPSRQSVLVDAIEEEGSGAVRDEVLIDELQEGSA